MIGRDYNDDGCAFCGMIAGFCILFLLGCVGVAAYAVFHLFR
jgi:hypothetical protein